jgi:hypothetical protein
MRQTHYSDNQYYYTQKWSKGVCLQNTSDYSPFGVLLDGRTMQKTGYRYGFNTQENVDEVSGLGNHTTAIYWEYNPRNGRRWNLDPVFYPWESRYSTFHHNPIIFIDPKGLFGTRKEAKEYRKQNNLSGRVKLNQDGIYSIDNRKAGTSIFRDEQFGVQKAFLCEVKRGDSKDITPWELGMEWLSGKGPKSREFGSGDFITEMYKNHDHVEQTRQMVINQLNQSNGKNTRDGSNAYSLKGVEGFGQYLMDYLTIATVGLSGNLVYTFLGSHSLQFTINSVDIKKRTAIVTLTVHNTSTMQSATRPPIIGYQEWYKNSIGKLTDKLFNSGAGSETEQWIEWTENIKY